MTQHAHDLMAEQALLGAAILAHRRTLPAFLSVPADAYYLPKHQLLAGLIREMVIRKQPVDEITVLSMVQESGSLRRMGGAPYLHTLVATPYTAMNAEFYASRIVELFGRRRLWETLTRETQMLDADWATGELSRSIADSVGVLRATCDEVVAYSTSTQVPPPMTLDEFLAVPDHYDWLVPGLLERKDRLILTGSEGLGKTEFATQIAMSVAGGVHPFTGEPAVLDQELRVLIIDCENQEGQSRRRYRRIAGAVDSARAMYQLPAMDWGKRLAIELRSGGLDITAPADAAWLESVITAAAPDLLLLGPLYKIHDGDINSAETAGKMLRTIDGLRERHRFALVTEAHASKAQNSSGVRAMEPEGSALFLRWPEYGMGLRADKDEPGKAYVVGWRGHREERDWPGVVYRRNSGLLPWGPDAEYYSATGNWSPPDDEMTVR